MIKKRIDPIMKCNGGEVKLLKGEKIGVRLADVSRRMKKKADGEKGGRKKRKRRERGRRCGIRC